MTIKAIAVKNGMNNSAVASVSYTIKGTVATPAFSVAAGVVDSGTEVTISCATEGAVIYYTTDGSEPTTASATYSAVISITSAQTIKAIAVKDGMNNSAVASVSYTINAPATPDYSTCVVGDFILKDDSILSKDQTPESGTVAAVIVRAKDGDTPALGVGIVHYKSGIAWCTSNAAGFSINIEELQGDETSGYMDGSDSWEKVKAACSDAEEHPEYYPAFNYCLTYATGKGFSETLATGWYLPTVAELKTIYDNNKNNDGVIEASLTKAGGNKFENGSYWSCCTYSSAYYGAIFVSFINGETGLHLKRDAYGSVCSVRAFY